MQVPAYARGVNLISGAIAQLPFTQWANSNPYAAKFLAQPEPGRPAWVTKQRTVQDLIGHGVAYWKIETVSPLLTVSVIPAETVTAQPGGKMLTLSDGKAVPVSDPTTDPDEGDVIVFTGFRDGTLMTGVDVLTTALALERASLNYAETPHPGDVLENVSNYEMNDAEVVEMLDKWQAARGERSVAYTNMGIKLADAKGWSPSELALVEQRNQSALQIARLLNLDPFWVGASVSGSALTYQNRVDARTDLYGLTLADYILPIEQRMSMKDVVGGTVRMDAAEFLRANLNDRVTMAVALTGAQIITPEQAADWISDKPTGGPA